MVRKRFIFMAIFLFISFILFLAGCSKQESPDEILKSYLIDWHNLQYSSMYSYLSKNSKSTISNKDFVDRYKKISSGIELHSIYATFNSKNPKISNGKATIPFTVKWYTDLAGSFKQNYTANLIKEKDGWKIDWTPSMIFPELKDGYKVQANIIAPIRGEILDRNGFPLAINEPGYEVGLVPSKMTDNSINMLSPIIGINTNTINTLTHQSWVKPDSFVPIKLIPKTIEVNLENQLLAIPGVMINKSQSTARFYPNGQLASQTIGYLGPITADELKSNNGEGYSSNDIIGKTGVEKAFEKQLRGTAGGQISIVDNNGNIKSILSQKKMINGSNVTLTINTILQRNLEASLNGLQGAAVVLDQNTGEVLAMASTPTFDLNNLSNAQSGSFVNLALSAIVPGSSFKPFTTAIALDTHAITENTVFDDPIKWQKNSTWGNYFVKRVGHPAGIVNLTNALVWSDNVYFAQVGLKIGKDNFINGLHNFGLGNYFKFDLPVQSGQISNNGSIDKEIQLADSSYGQGQVLVSPLQLASMYTAFTNGGKVLRPFLIKGESVAPISENAATLNTCNVIMKDLSLVVSDPSGTAHNIANVTGFTVSGKTGTAETGVNGSEYGWFASFDNSLNGSAKYITVMVIANTQNQGGSHLAVDRTKMFLMAK